ncbi:MAG: hypothetical protein DRP02_14260 [Candidatus Gerdarchaeota archaeon]|nr:MAG: hypothetical protein DRP02_14260 [Candidatus Gerdarchaeota archaeon]
MTQQFVTTLIGFIAAYCREVRVGLSKTQLVKFLYLADLFYARRHKQTLTKWPWRYWHYGPYCEEAIESIEVACRLGIINFDEGPEGEVYIRATTHNSNYFERFIPFEILQPLKYHINRFGGDLAALLSYVYSETEPMVFAKHGDFLDFSKAQELPPLTKIYVPKMSGNRYKKCLSLIKKLTLRRKETQKTRQPLALSQTEVEAVERFLAMVDSQEDNSDFLLDLTFSEK